MTEFCFCTGVVVPSATAVVSIAVLRIYAKDLILLMGNLYETLCNAQLKYFYKFFLK
jgi:hypothetical protein